MTDESTNENYPLGDAAGRFEEVRVLGVGALSKVIHVRDKENGNQDLALKVLSKNAKLDKHIRERFLAELEILCSINHRNIIKAHELLSYRGHDAFTMELVKGKDLGAYFRDGSVKDFSVVEVISIMRQLLSALEEIHSRDVVHRDIKPENILITPDGTIKLSDFGFVKYLREDPKTDPGYILGTVSYVAPEYYLNQEIDAQADIYSAGVLMWELVTAGRRFPGLTAEEVIRNLNASNFSHPELSFEPENATLGLILKKAVAFNKQDRFQSAAAMREAFEQTSSQILKGKTRDTKTMLVIFLIIGLGLFAYLATR